MVMTYLLCRSFALFQNRLTGNNTSNSAALEQASIFWKKTQELILFLEDVFGGKIDYVGGIFAD